MVTSGGDSPGMNAALRGIVRRVLDRGHQVSVVREGYSGLVRNRIEDASWGLVSGIQMLGGTLLGSSRSDTFRTLEGRRQVVANLVGHGIDALAVIGGDGSLTGAVLLAAEWTDHQTALVERGHITAEQMANHPTLRLVGIAGSIDNDLCGTDSTVGSDSALHRIIDAIDAIRATAGSHRRAFVIEVMGRRCGYLATAAAVCTGADIALVPEDPLADWAQAACRAVQAGRDAGQRQSILILAEGAADRTGARIHADDLRKAVQDGTGIETRVTVLGHVQRGGVPSAADRIVATRLGARAADVLLDHEPAVLVGTAGDAIITTPLADCIRDTVQIHRLLDAGDAKGAMALRSIPQQLLHHVWQAGPKRPGARVLVAHVGAPAPGMNAALHAIARTCDAHGAVALGAIGGLRGIVDGSPIQPLNHWALRNALAAGATQIGTDRRTPSVDALRVQLDAHEIDAVVLVGGFEAMQALPVIEACQRSAVCVPATISNNVPGTDRSVGHDTALNAILDGVDRLRQSAMGSGDRVFVVEVMGRKCGALARQAAIGTGAELVYTHEDGVDLERLSRDAENLRRSFVAGRQVGIVLIADGVPRPFDASTLAAMFTSESKGYFDARVCVLGHLQQGGRPSPLDRLAATLLGAAATRAVLGGCSASVVALRDGEVAIVPLSTALETADLVHRRPLRTDPQPALPEPFRATERP